jgi:hypothetical protein
MRGIAALCMVKYRLHNEISVNAHIGLTVQSQKWPASHVHVCTEHEPGVIKICIALLIGIRGILTFAHVCVYTIRQSDPLQWLPSSSNVSLQ